MADTERPLHLVGGGEVFGPPAPAAPVETTLPAQRPPLPYGPGGGSPAAATEAFGHYAEAPVAPRPRAPAPQPPVRRLEATNIARRDNFAVPRIDLGRPAPAQGFEAATETPESERYTLPRHMQPFIEPLPRPDPETTQPIPAPTAGPPRVHQSPAPMPAAPRGPRRLDATNIARRDNFGIAPSNASPPSGFEPAD